MTYRLRLVISIVVLVACLRTAVPAAEKTPARLLTTSTPSGELAGWKSFLEDPKAKTGDVWRLGPDGVLACKGKPNGYLYTEKSYTDFTLTLEWRTPEGQKPGRGGILVRMTGPHKIWPKSLEAQLNAGDEGDFWGLDGYRLSGPSDRMKVIETSPFGRLTNVRKAVAAVKAPGQWNRYEVIARGQTVVLKINGQEVNRATGCDVVAGPICLTAEGDEIHFRNVAIVSPE
ncbi:MAG: DUF1080 domain-containing protein [Thermoguttaceae bacterium]|jgi:hypothetical protein|nr:DUF1080 domain-containing protein [Thermoguttaceae bacterium]